MTLALCRVDDRLIHGQVVIGWGIPLGVEHIVLVDDTVAANDWEQDIYRMAVPAGITVEFAGPAEAATRLPLDALGTLVEGPRGAFSPRLGQFVQGLLQRVSDGSIATFIACPRRIRP